MVDVKELRIGNWVYLPSLSKEAYGNGRVPFFVEGIYKYEDGYKVLCHCDTKEGYSCTEDALPEEIDPIPITEELLLKLGFKGDYGIFYKDDFELSYHSSSTCNVDTYKLFASVNCDEYVISNPIEYLHQLQNIYFCLEGKELEEHLS